MLLRGRIIAQSITNFIGFSYSSHSLKDRQLQFTAWGVAKQLNLPTVLRRYSK